MSVVTVRFGRPSFSLDQVRRNLLEGFGYSFASSTATAYNDIDKTMLSYYGMNAGNGIYSMAYRIIDVATIPILAIREAAMPRFFRSGLGGIRGAAPFAVVLLKRALPLGVLAAGWFSSRLRWFHTWQAAGFRKQYLLCAGFASSRSSAAFTR